MDKDFEMAYAKYHFQTEIIPRLLENDGELSNMNTIIEKIRAEIERLKKEG